MCCSSLLIGHGTSVNGEDAKFNLVGPDLSASEWAALLKPIPGRLVFVDTTGASFPFLQKLAGRGRVILTATDSAAQQFETVFPEFFIKAFERSGGGSRQERPRLVVGSVQLRERRRAPVVRAARPAADRASAARRQRRRRGAGGAESGHRRRRGARDVSGAEQRRRAARRSRRCSRRRPTSSARSTRSKRGRRRCRPMNMPPSSNGSWWSSRASRSRSARNRELSERNLRI